MVAVCFGLKNKYFYQLMIIIKLQGGLGNQLFQYAFGRSLSVKENKILKLDISNYDSDPLRSYKLRHFNIKERIAFPLEIFWSKMIKRLGFGQSSYLEGYWQSEKYFSDIEDTIRREFKLKDPLKNEAQKFSDEIKNTNSVSLHIRRGDYVTNDKLKGFLQPLPLAYYNEAIEIVEKKIDKPHFFVFSDDIAWVKDNLKINHQVSYVSGSGIEDHEELALMSQCKHNIIANSSFSWWGAWLNDNPGKIVIAPKNWFSDGDNSELIPNTWTTI